MTKQIINGTTYQRWRNKGIDVIAPTYVRTFLAVLGGARTVRQVSEATGIAETTTGGHLKRLKGWGLVDWGYSRAGTIHATMGVVECDAVTHGDILRCFELGDWTDGIEADTLVISEVMELRKGDMLTIEDHEYAVKEVRRGQGKSLAAVRLDVPDTASDWWVKLPVEMPVQGRRTSEATQRLARANGRE